VSLKRHPDITEEDSKFEIIDQPMKETFGKYFTNLIYSRFAIENISQKTINYNE
jgi:hypothetical protein